MVVPGVSFRAPHRFRDFRRSPLDHLIAAGELADVVSLAFPFSTVYLVSGPDCVRRVLQDNHQNYPDDPAVNGVFRSTIGDSVLTAEGELWRGSRDRARAAFSDRGTANLSATIVAETARMIHCWRNRARQSEPIELEQEFMVLNLKIAASIICGVDLGARAQPLANAIFETFECLSARILSPFSAPRWVPTAQNRRLSRAECTIRGIVAWLVDEAIKQEQPVSNFMRCFDRNEVSRRPYQMIDELVALIGTASATTAAGLVWACYLLTKSPEVERSVRAEAVRVRFGQGTADCYASGFEQIRMTILETLRLYPPAWAMTARSVGSDRLGSVEIPSGAKIVISPYVTHRLERLWDRPETFDPGRFARVLSGEDLAAYFPFGRGPRRCIGERFAMMQMSLILAMIAREFNLRATTGQAVEPRVAFTLRTTRGFWVRPVETCKGDQG
jgi:cytochrome P450